MVFATPRMICLSPWSSHLKWCAPVLKPMPQVLRCCERGHFFETIVRHIPKGTKVCNRNGKITQWQNYALRVGCSPELRKLLWESTTGARALNMVCLKKGHKLCPNGFSKKKKNTHFAIALYKVYFATCCKFCCQTKGQNSLIAPKNTQKIEKRLFFKGNKVFNLNCKITLANWLSLSQNCGRFIGDQRLVEQNTQEVR